LQLSATTIPDKDSKIPMFLMPYACAHYRVIVSHNACFPMLCVFKVRKIRCQHFGQSHDCFACKTKNEMASLWGCQLHFKQAKKFSCNVTPAVSRMPATSNITGETSHTICP